MAGAPKVTSELLSEITLMTGTMWHEFIHDTLRRLGVPYMAEVNLNPWLPPGWGGTADAVIWHPELKGFVLTDYKTQKGEGMRYIAKDGPKAEHKAQASAYWYALKKMGIPLVKKIGVYYLPKNGVRGQEIEPILADFDPLPARALHKLMNERSGRVSDYIASLEPGNVEKWRNATLQDWITDELAPPSEREQRVYYDRKNGIWELKLVPHWTAGFCPYPDELCSCSTQSTTKIGFYDLDGTYYARTGFEEIEPTVEPPAG